MERWTPVDAGAGALNLPPTTQMEPMKATYQFADADNLDATLSVTMKVSEWRQLMRQMPTGWPSWKFSAAIADMIAEANRRFDLTHTAADS